MKKKSHPSFLLGHRRLDGRQAGRQPALVTEMLKKTGSEGLLKAIARLPCAKG